MSSRQYTDEFKAEAIEQVQDWATRRLWTYNHERPNMLLAGITPAMKLAMAVWLHSWRLIKMADYHGFQCQRDFRRVWRRFPSRRLGTSCRPF